MNKKKQGRKHCLYTVLGNRQGMEMVQVAILVAIAVTLGLVFKSQIGDFVDNTFSSLSNAKF
ncbi:MAG: Flp1 family type IVb pilin [Firmicutes bacterium]|nr:hypothetical protein [Bacillota bacterium]MDD7602817.1 Flp1 family type IVb pilin [Bacillota bacterium]MDY5855760.1 Flp1 family type IVb pilin [Anaerovoracaceae bacterium]